MPGTPKDDLHEKDLLKQPRQAKGATGKRQEREDESLGNLFRSFRKGGGRGSLERAGSQPGSR